MLTITNDHVKNVTLSKVVLGVRICISIRVRVLISVSMHPYHKHYKDLGPDHPSTTILCHAYFA
jgi:hypothetical protein